MSEPADDNSAEASAVKQMKRRLTLATGVVTWLAAVIGPAITFDVLYLRTSTMDGEFKAYFLVVSAVLFLIGWKFIGRLKIGILGLLALVSAASFLGYSKAKSEWTCPYFPKIYASRLTMGTELTSHAREVLAEYPPRDNSCEARMAPFGGDGLEIWEEDGIYHRFLSLFGLYALAWLSLALLVLGAVSYNLSRSEPE